MDIRCPAIGCSLELLESDLRRLVRSGELSEDVCKRFVELRARDYEKRAKSFETMPVRSDEDVAFLQTLRSMRQCPRCHVLLQRSEGCDSFYCVCGAHFDYGAALPGIGGLTQTWGETLRLARQKGISISQATEFERARRLHGVELTVKRLRGAERTASQNGMSVAAAVDLHIRAKQGYAGARARIRRGRAKFAGKSCWPFLMVEHLRKVFPCLPRGACMRSLTSRLGGFKARRTSRVRSCAERASIALRVG